MKAIIILILISISSTFSFATSYYTILDGSWSDPGIWSTDGITPCSCSPSYNLMGDTVVIDHAVVQDAGLTVLDDAFLKVGVSGKLDGSGYTMAVINARFLSNGNVTTKKLLIGDEAIFTIQLAELVILTRLEVYGVLNIYTSNLNVVLGNVNIYAAGIVNLEGGSKLHFDSGNYQNAGITNVGPGSCIQIDSGNIQNEVGGVVNGSGSMITDAGNVQNEGSWDVNILWCSAGFDFGMPSSESCLEANENCLGVPLPVELVLFEGTAKPGCNDIVWITATEYNCDYFVLERSDEGKKWTERAVVDGAGTTSLESYYSVCDNITEVKTYYYRIIQYDYNRDMSISNVITVHSVGLKPTEMYPNPSQGEFFLLLDGHEPGMEVIIYDVNGMPVYQKNDIVDNKVAFQLQLPSGLYLVHINRKGNVETLKLVIR